MDQKDEQRTDSKAAIEFLFHFSSLLRAVRLYPHHHPIPVKSLAELRTTIEHFFAGHTFLRLRLRRQKLFVHSTLVSEGDELLESLSLYFYTLGIRELTFYQGVNETDMLTFVDAIIMDPKQIKGQGGIEQLWPNERHPAIKINETLNRQRMMLKENDAQSGGVPECGLRVDELIFLSEIIQQEEDTLSEQESQLLDSLIAQPQSLARMATLLAHREGLEQVADTGIETTLQGEMPEDIVAAYRQMLKFLERVCLVPQKEEMIQHLAESFFLFNEEIKNSLLHQLFLFAGPDANQGREILVDNKENILLAQVAAALRQEVFSTVSPDRRQQEGQIGEQELLSPEEIADIEYQDLSPVSEMAAEFAMYSESELREVEEFFAAFQDDYQEGIFLSVMEELLAEENTPMKYQKVLSAIKLRVRDSLDNGRYQWAVRYLAMIVNQVKGEQRNEQQQGLLLAAWNDLGGKEIIQKLVESLESVDKDDARFPSLNQYLMFMPKGSIVYLLDVLAAEGKMNVRRILCQIISIVGEQDRDALYERLHDSNWYIVRNVVMILGMMNDKKSGSHLHGLLYHENVRVRLEVLKSLCLTEDSQAFGCLVDRLTDENPTVRQFCIEWLGNLHDRRAITVLLRVLKKFDPLGFSTALKKEAITSLGELGAKEALPLLVEIARGSWLFFFGPTRPLQIEAQRAIEHLTRILP